jgi:hypothetical protein
MRFSKNVVTLLLSVLLCLMGLTGIAMSANVKDSDWSFYDQNNTGRTAVRMKENNTNVYVYPEAGISLYYGVDRYLSGNYTVLRTPVYIKTGTKATIRSSASTNNLVAVSILNKNTSTYGYTIGVWSPDSTQYYTVY